MMKRVVGEQSIVVIIILYIVLNVNAIKFYKSLRSGTVYRANPCENDDTIVSVFEPGLKAGYNITIKKNLESGTFIRLKFDSQAAVFWDGSAIFSSDQDEIENIFTVILLKNRLDFTFNVRGQAAPFAPPYLESLKINEEELCSKPNLTYFSDFRVGVLSNVDRGCGRRKILHTELIVQGVKTKPGDWPWHAAIHRHEGANIKYVCGGTLISKHFVLTAAHCAAINGIPLAPEIFGVTLGKYNLYGGDIATQEKEVYRVYVHGEFRPLDLKNDIAMLKLRTEAVYNNYVQPACLWSKSAGFRMSENAYGTVVGWGFDQSDTLTSTLHVASMPWIPNLNCVYSNPVFYGKFLRVGKRFCAGFDNGTSVCNGDSGGAFAYFVPDIAGTSETNYSVPGAWYVIGIVSITLKRPDANICDPNAYTIFTNVTEYLPWIRNILDF